jgi:hypothetical protein
MIHAETLLVRACVATRLAPVSRLAGQPMRQRPPDRQRGGHNPADIPPAVHDQRLLARFSNISPSVRQRPGEAYGDLWWRY